MLDAVAARLLARINVGSNQSASPSQQSPAAPSQSPVQSSEESLSRSSSLATLHSAQFTPIEQQVQSLPSAADDGASSLSRSSSLNTLMTDESEEESQFPDNLDDNLEEFTMSYDGITSKRGSRVLYREEDKVIVNFPLMNLLDAKYLAPITSVLFMHQRKKGSAEFKKNADLRFEQFKTMVKRLIRTLVSEGYNPRPGNLAHRYFWCAYDIVRKRRANHVQSWRTRHCPKDLIYGGKEWFIATYGDPWSNNRQYTKKKVRSKKKKRLTTRQLSFLNSNQDNVQQLRNKRVDKPGSRITKPGASITKPDASIAKPLIAKPDASIASPVAQKPRASITEPVQLDDETLASFEADPFDDGIDCVEAALCNDNIGFNIDDDNASHQLLSKGFFTCAGCCNNIERADGFPKCNEEWAMENNDGVDLRCKRCFDELTRNTFLPELNEQLEKAEKQKQTKKSRVKSKKPCKCGSQTHSLPTSSLCPLNKKYNRHEADKAAVKKRAMAGAAARRRALVSIR